MGKSYIGQLLAETDRLRRTPTDLNPMIVINPNKGLRDVYKERESAVPWTCYLIAQKWEYTLYT